MTSRKDGQNRPDVENAGTGLPRDELKEASQESPKSINEVLEDSLSGLRLSMRKSSRQQQQAATVPPSKSVFTGGSAKPRKDEQAGWTLRVSPQDLQREMDKIKEEMVRKNSNLKNAAANSRVRITKKRPPTSDAMGEDEAGFQLTSNDIFGSLIDDIESGRVDESELTKPGTGPMKIKTEAPIKKKTMPRAQPQARRGRTAPGVRPPVVEKARPLSGTVSPDRGQPATGPVAAKAEPIPASPQIQHSGSNEYQLLSKIATGGMAEVWKGKLIGEKGFEKIVAIKKILSHLGDNEEFISMFIDEAKVAANLTHPNIAQIYELGKMGDSFFIAMEYVAGHNLRTIFNALNSLNTTMAPEVAVYIGMKLCNALHYAHNKKGYDNQPLHIVHRDVSPQNILISGEGEIKLVDFGIAKASIKASQTIAGSLKGKLLYMSPEQADGKPIDKRSDIFSLGSVLFEALTGRKLFVGDSELSILKNVRQANFPQPRELNPKISEPLEKILLKALSRDPNRRYASAKDLENDLKEFLKQEKIHINESEVADFIKLVSLKDKAGLTHFGMSRPVSEEPRPGQPGIILPEPDEDTAYFVKDATRPPKGSRPIFLYILGAAAVFLIGVLVWIWVSEPSVATPSAGTEPTATGPSADTQPPVGTPVGDSFPVPLVEGPTPADGAAGEERKPPDLEEDEELKRLQEEFRKKSEELKRLKKKE